jgi:hypothetical protein
MWTYGPTSVGEMVCVIPGFRREIDEALFWALAQRVVVIPYLTRHIVLKRR